MPKYSAATSASHDSEPSNIEAVDELALAGALALTQRDHDPEGAHQPTAAEVGDLPGRLDGRPVGVAGEAQHPVEAEVVHVVAGAVAVRPVLAVAGDRAVDEARVDASESLVADPEPVEHARAERLEQHVGVAGEPEQDLLALLVLEIDPDRALRPVERQEQRALGRVLRTLVVRR